MTDAQCVAIIAAINPHCQILHTLRDGDCEYAVKAAKEFLDEAKRHLGEPHPNVGVVVSMETK